MSKYARRKDENHNEIEDTFRRLLADHVTNTSSAGGGIGDLYVSFGGHSGPAWGCHVEVKRDSKADFTAAQIRFRNSHPGMHYRIETVEEATALCAMIRVMVTHLAKLASPHV